MIIKKLFISSLLLQLVTILFIFPNILGQKINIVRDYYLQQPVNNNILIIKADNTPDFEIVNFPAKNTITFKIRNASLPKSLIKSKQFSGFFFKDANISKANNNEVWLEIHTHRGTYEYNVDKNKLEEGLIVFQLKTVSPTKKYDIEDINGLISIDLQSNIFNEILILTFNKEVDYRTIISTLPEVNIDLILPGIKRQFAIEKNQIDSEFIKGIRYQDDKDDALVISVLINTPLIEYQIDKKKHPHRLEIKIEKSNTALSISTEDRLNFFNYRKLISQDDEIYKYYFIEAEEVFRNGDYPNAIEKFKEIVSNTPSSEIRTLALFRISDIAYEQQKIEKKYDGNFNVINYYQNAIDNAKNLNILPSEVARATVIIGKNYQQGKLYEEAEDSYNDVIQNYPNSGYISEALFAKASLKVDQKEYANAIRLFQNYLLEYPKSSKLPTLYYQLGTSYHAIAKYDLANNYFIAARSIDQKKEIQAPNILFAQANTHFKLEQYQKFVDSSRQLISNYPDNILSSFIAIDLGDYFYSESNFDSARFYYELTIDNELEDEDIKLIARLKLNNLWSNLGVENNLNSIVDEYNSVFNDSENIEIKEEALLHLAITYFNYGRYNLASQAFERYINNFPNGMYVRNGAINSLIINNISKLVTNAYFSDKFSDVISYYVRFRIFIIENQNQLLFRLIADSYSKLNNFRDSIAFYQQLIKISLPEQIGELNFEIGENFLAAGIMDEAIKYYQEAAANSNDTVFAPYSLSRLVYIYNFQKKYNLAVETVKQLLADTINTSNPIVQDLVSESWYSLAELQNQLGQFDEALTSYANVQNTYKHPIRDPNALDIVSLSFFKLGDMSRLLSLDDQALIQYQTAIQLFPDSNQAPWALYYSSEILLKQQNYLEAYELLQRLIQEYENANPYLIRLVQENIREIDINRQYANFLQGDSEN